MNTSILGVLDPVTEAGAAATTGESMVGIGFAFVIGVVLLLSVVKWFRKA